ncbi:SDR family oxidoreductase [Paenibacillus antri]|uniref:SDR family oxidoreductase n=1 Tax=Paenibacillus antri TaxID=2582848 RepID=A0A5R9GH21_9BACL|nr:SDR family NAD(P)-dependent oxidoreductase [Paenibacillus antri]TLS52698.1 SDR family oxidoreductase [Paenibacillus antri]
MSAKPSNGRTALVTGASRGIGRGIAFSLAESGYDLVITHLNEPEEADRAASEIQTVHGRKCTVLQSDLSLPGAPDALADRAIRSAGRIHVLVNNAGVTMLSKLVEMETEKLDYLINLNLRAPLLMMKAIGRHMKDQGIRGNIVNIASTRGERAYPLDAVYGATKAALLRATQSVALELSTHGIRANTIAPGAIQVREGIHARNERLARNIPLQRMGTPDDIGKAVAWLVSDEASYMTGATLRIDGGLILPGMPETGSAADGGWGRVD